MVAAQTNKLRCYFVVYAIELNLAPDLPGLERCFTKEDRIAGYKNVEGNPDVLEPLGDGLRGSLFYSGRCSSETLNSIIWIEALPVSADEDQPSTLGVNFMLICTQEIDTGELFLSMSTRIAEQGTQAADTRYELFTRPIHVGDGFSGLKHNYTLSQPMWLESSDSEDDKA